MALALIGESVLSAVIKVLMIKLASPEVLAFFKSHKLNDDLLEKLKETMNTVNGLLDDAEEKQITKDTVKNWLNDVKHAVYQAEDLLEGIDCELMRSKDKAASHPVRTKAGKFIPFLNPANKRMKEMEAQLKKIYEKIERLVKHKGDLRHIEGTSRARPLSEKTTPLVNESHVYGREADKEAIMELLTRNEANGPNVVVIPIVGMGGIGKTTLAQLIYNDNRVEVCFELKAWVWTSEQFDITRIMVDFLKKIRAGTRDDQDPDESLKEALRGKKFLLVLDDAWNIEYNEWDKLLLPMQYAEQGSKIILTTRIKDVAKVTQTVIPPYPLNGIGNEDCWQLFARHAFSGVNSGALSHLEAFGREIVRKCKGLPLAVKTLGGLLHSEGDAKEWERISNSNMWGLSNEKIPPALRLSYYYLPSHLKRCFVYCAIFPKGYQVIKEEIIPLWMAEGFLNSEGNEETERIGEKYFNDLVSRSFFQQSPNGQSYFIMHDLISDLAEYAAGEFCFKILGDEECDTLPIRSRFLSFYSIPHRDRSRKFFEGLQKVQHLRTLYLPSSYSHQHYDDNVLDNIFAILKRSRVLKRLRVLCFRSHLLSQLPNSIGNLKYLRHLDLSMTPIQRLPENVSTLYYLQTLLLKWCVLLTELPTNTSKLVNLEHLDIEGTNLKEMPSKLGKLTKLQTLPYFTVGKDSGSSIKELGNLLHIRKEFSILNLQNVAHVEDALDANLKGKKQIEKLQLTWNFGNKDDPQHERDVLDKLEPSENVKQLVITGYGGVNFPGWVGNSFCSNMVYLKLEDCRNCTSLPPLGQLPSLEELNIVGFNEVVAVSSEFYGSDCSFKSLKKLKFWQMRKWQEWNTDVAGTFPSLLELEIIRCPQLAVTIPAAPKLTMIKVNDDDFSHDKIRILSRWGCLTFTEDSNLKGMEQLSHANSSSFIDIEIDKCNSLKCCQVDLLPQIFTFTITHCLNLESLICAERPIQFLRHLAITNCPNLVSFLEGGLAAPDLRSLKLEDCLYLKSLPENMHSLLPSLEKLELRSLPQLDSFPKGGLPSKLKKNFIHDCIELKVCGFQSFPSLSSFIFIANNDVESFPQETLLPSNLDIPNVQNLKSLDHKGLQHLTSLKELRIRCCPKLDSMFKHGLPSSLEGLGIRDQGSLDYIGLQHLTSLSELSVHNCPKLESMSEQGLPSSLEYLYIRGLESLEYMGLQHLTSLSTLTIWSCPKLECMPEQGLPSSVQHLKIHNCPLLAKRCERRQGKIGQRFLTFPR